MDSTCEKISFWEVVKTFFRVREGSFFKFHPVKRQIRSVDLEKTYRKPITVCLLEAEENNVVLEHWPVTRVVKVKKMEVTKLPVISCFSECDPVSLLVQSVQPMLASRVKEINRHTIQAKTSPVTH